VFQNGSTDGDGALTINNAPLGTYEARVDNVDGYQAKADTFSHASSSGTSRTMTLQPVLGKILGKVTASATGTGLLNAKVTATSTSGQEWTALSNSQGNYSLGVPYGTWSVKAQAAGHQVSATSTVSLNSSSPSRTADFALAAHRFTLSGTVRNSFSQQGIFGATVFLTQGAETRSLNTDGDGNFSFPVPAGTFTLRASSAGFASPEPLSLAVDGDRVQNLTLDPNASILTGRTKDPSGSAVAGALIQAAPRAGPVRSVVSDAQGYFELSLPAGDWSLSSTAKGYTPRTSHKFLLDVSKTVQGVDFVLEPNLSFVSGRVTENGAGLAGVLVSTAGASGITGQGGYYLFSLGAGTHTVRAARDGYLIAKTYTVASGPGDTVKGIDFSATGNAGVIRGKVLSGGAGVIGAQVQAVNQVNNEPFSAATDGAGAFALSLPGGTYKLSAAREGFVLDQSVTLSLPPGGTVLDANLRLILDQGTLAGTIMSGNLALAGCEVAYSGASNPALAGKTVTDPQGRYSLSLQVGLAYALTATCPGYQPGTSTSGVLARGSTLALAFNLTKAGSILKGKVVDGRGALAGVTVSAAKDGEAITATSGFDGAFQLSLGSGTYTLSLSKTGYKTLSAQASLIPGENNRAADTLVSALGRLSGRVLSDGAGVPGALASLVGLTPGAGGGVFATDAGGRFSAEGVPAGTYSLTASANGYSEGKIASLTIVAGALANADVSVAADRGVLSGKVAVTGASPAAVKVVANSYGVSRSATPSADGGWTIDRLPGGVYTVSAGLDGYSADRVREGLSLGSAATLANLDFTLTKNAGSLSGTVSGAGSAAGIQVALAGKKGGRAYAACDAAGKFSFPSLPEDTYAITVTAPGYKLSGATQSPEVSVSAPVVRNLELVPAVFRLSGRAVNQTGLAIGGIPMELRHPTGKAQAVTAADGSYAFANVPAGGEYQLSFKPPTSDYDARDSIFALGLDAASEITLDLSTVSRRASLSGSVLLDGAAVEGALLRLTGPNNDIAALSQPGGGFRIAGIAGSDATLSLKVTRAGAGTVDTAIKIAVAQNQTGFMVRLRTVKVALTGTLRNSEGKPVAGGKVVLAGGAEPDTLTASPSGTFASAGLASNQSLSLITLLDGSRYDNVEAPVLIKENDTSIDLRVPVHATTVAVQVKDQDGAAVDGAEVLMNGKSLGTTSQGTLTVRGLARGEYRFVAGKASYRSSPESRLALPGDTSATLTLAVAKVVGGLYGVLGDSGLVGATSELSGRKLAGAVVTVVSGNDTLRDTTNSLGQYFVDGLADGRTYAIAVVLPGYRTLRDSIVANPQARNRDLVLRPLEGAVVGQVSPAKAGVPVHLLHAAGGRVLRAVTVAGGYFGFHGLLDRNDYLVQAFDGSKTSPPSAFQALGGSARRADLVLDARGSIAGKASGSGLGALPGVLVQARNLLTGSLAWTLTDSSGAYAIAGLSPGDYSLSAERLGFRAPALRNATVSMGKASEGFDFSLEARDAGIAGVVVDGAGRAVPAALALSRGTDTARLSAGGGGQFVFPGLEEGTYSLGTGEPGYSAAPAEVDYGGKGLTLATLRVSRASNRILGVIRDAVTNTPIVGAAIGLAGSGSPGAASDAQGRFQLAVPAGSASPAFLEASKSGYRARSGLPVILDGDGSAIQDLSLTADYRHDGQISVTVREGEEILSGLALTLVPFHPDDIPQPAITGAAPNSFRNLRRPAPYSLTVKRAGHQDLSQVVELTADAAVRNITLSYPTSRIRVFVTADGRRGKGVGVTVGGRPFQENPDTAGLYAGPDRMQPDRYEINLLDPDSGLVPMAARFVELGEDSVRIDTLFSSFRKSAIADSIIGADFQVRMARTDTVLPAPGVAARLFYRLEGAALWDSLELDSVAGGFAGTLPAQEKAGTYEYYNHVRSPFGVRIGVTTPQGTRVSTAEAFHSNAQAPSRFRLRDPFLLQSIALLPQRLEADTSLYSLDARDLFQAQLRGENGRSLDAYFDARASDGDGDFTVDWSFADADLARNLGLSLSADSSTPRISRFRGGRTASDSVIRILCSVRMGEVRLSKTFLAKIQDLAPVAIGIRYVKENRILEEDGASLSLPNDNPGGFAFSAFARTAEGRFFNIAPRWSLGSDTAAGSVSQQGVFTPRASVARSAVLRIDDTLSVEGAGSGPAVTRKAFSFRANLTTVAQVAPATVGTTVVTDGEGAVLEFNLAGLAKAFTVSVKQPKVSGLLRASPQEEVVGDILDIELSESQPFKADSGAVLRLPVASGIARRGTVYLGHWNTSRLLWEKVAEAKADSVVSGTVYGFSKYAVLMGSLPLGAYDFVAKPNPFSAMDPWGLQLDYKVSSDVSSQVVVRVEVYNMMGDKVYESQETQLSKGEAVAAGTHKAAPGSGERRTALGPFVWDGRDTQGNLCRNGRYLLKLIVKDGKGRKEYLKKVVMLK
jgi:hypothetical protein